MNTAHFSHKRRRWTIEHRKELRDDDGQRCVGITDMDKRQILIDEDEIRDNRESTLIHEVLHVACPYLAEETILEIEKVLFRAITAYKGI